VAEKPEALAAWTEQERSRRRAKFEQIRDAMGEAGMEAWKQGRGPRPARAAEAIELLNRLQTDWDDEAFRRGLDQWSRRPGYQAFGGFGQMWSS
jgi:hypothetical protein